MRGHRLMHACKRVAGATHRRLDRHLGHVIIVDGDIDPGRDP